MTAGGQGARGRFGSIRRLPSGRWQARYRAHGAMHTAGITFDTKGHAEVYLATVRADLVRGLWRPPERPGTLTFADYAAGWLDKRTLKPRTRVHYRWLLDTYLLPTFAGRRLPDIGPDDVRTWWAKLTPAKPTARAHAYGLLRTMLADAAADRLIAENPCKIRGAGRVRRAHQVRPATLAELGALVAAMPERYGAMTLLAGWCGLRFGELAELRRGDVDLRRGVLRVRRAVARAGPETIVGTPKTTAGVRDVAIPPHLLPALTEHLAARVGPERDALLFPAAGGGHLRPSTLYRVFYRAREQAGRPDLRWHDLRHTGAVLAAATGATLAELMARLGHSSPAAALRYQHAAADRDRAIAEALSKLAAAP